MTKKTSWTSERAWFISIWQIYMMIQMEWIQYKSFFVIFFSFLGKKQPLNLLFMKRCRMDWVMRWYNRPPPALGLRFPKIWSPWQIWCQQLVQFLKKSWTYFLGGGLHWSVSISRPYFQDIFTSFRKRQCFLYSFWIGLSNMKNNHIM